MKNIKGKTNHTDERERKVIQMKKLLALIFTFAILVSVTGIAAALVDPETGVDYPEEGYITYSVEYSPEKAQELLDEVNEFRRSNAWFYGSDGSVQYAGVLDDLILDDSLTEAAMYRAAQQAVKASHTQPGGGSGCYNIHKDVVAENIDFGSETAHQAFTGLAEEQCTFNGQGHRRSMLSNATHVGVGCATINGVTYWVIEYAYGEPTHEANTMMTEDTVTTLVNTNVVNTSRKKVVLKASASSVTCKVGETVALPTPNVIIDFGREPYIENLTTTPVDVTWVSNDGSVATVSGGSVTGVKEGRTSATASYFGQTVNVSVIVEPAETTKACTHSNVSERVVTNATCTADGKKEKYCMECGEVIETITLPKTGHSISERVTKEATHTAEGTKEKYCTVCGTVTETITIPKTTGHTVAERVVTNATCTDDGTKEKYCMECGEVIETITLPKTGHTIAERIAKEATITSEGTKETYCKVCETVISTSAIPKKACDHSRIHEYSEPEATCINEGKRYKQCLECYASLGCDTIPKTDHNLAKRVTKEATATSEGIIETYCTVCGVVTATESIPKTACTHERTTETVTLEPKCWREGTKDICCADCGAFIRTEKIKKVAHQWSPTYDPAYTQDNGDKGFPCLEENCNAVLMRFASECD